MAEERTTREQLIDLMQRAWHERSQTTGLGDAALDALLSPEGRPLLYEMLLSGESRDRLTDAVGAERMVEYLKERGVLVPHGWYGAQGEGKPDEVCLLRLPSTTKSDSISRRFTVG